jgi:hypothetical protein
MAYRPGVDRRSPITTSRCRTPRFGARWSASQRVTLDSRGHRSLGSHCPDPKRALRIDVLDLSTKMPADAAVPGVVAIEPFGALTRFPTALLELQPGGRTTYASTVPPWGNGRQIGGSAYQLPLLSGANGIRLVLPDHSLKVSSEHHQQCARPCRPIPLRNK